VRLDTGGQPLLARITRRAREQLDLQPGTELYALIKGAVLR
ncbi:MAG: TOBE domain-containing protein, partial [Halorhodospira sp.]